MSGVLGNQLQLRPNGRLVGQFLHLKPEPLADPLHPEVLGQDVSHDAGETLVAAVHERLQKDARIAHENVMDAHLPLDHAEAQLKDFTERYVK